MSSRFVTLRPVLVCPRCAFSDGRIWAAEVLLQDQAQPGIETRLGPGPSTKASAMPELLQPGRQDLDEAILYTDSFDTFLQICNETNIEFHMLRSGKELLRRSQPPVTLTPCVLWVGTVPTEKGARKTRHPSRASAEGGEVRPGRTWHLADRAPGQSSCRQAPHAGRSESVRRRQSRALPPRRYHRH